MDMSQDKVSDAEAQRATRVRTPHRRRIWLLNPSAPCERSVAMQMILEGEARKQISPAPSSEGQVHP